MHKKYSICITGFILCVCCTPLFSLQDAGKETTVLEDVKKSLQNNVNKLQVELDSLHWLHPRHNGINRRIKELQSRIQEVVEVQRD